MTPKVVCPLAFTHTHKNQPDNREKETFQNTGCKHPKTRHEERAHGRLTERLQLSRVEIVQQTEEAALHLLDIGDVREEGVLDGGGLSPLPFSCLRSVLLFHHSAETTQLTPVRSLRVF